MGARRQVRFPRITEFRLNNFDLYTRQPNLSLSIERDVFCLIGANGLGKSTFLNTLLFVLTGAVPNYRRRFQSAEDYFREASRVDRGQDYFDGRLSDDARDLIRATITLVWPTKEVSVTRSIFAQGRVVRLHIEDRESGSREELSAEDASTDDELDRRYRDEVTSNCGLGFFYQFTFLLHLVCAFDEERHLLLWDKDALTSALYLAFGTDAETAQKAAKLQRDVEKAGSRARNAAFMAKKSADQIDELNRMLSGDVADDGQDSQDLNAQFTRLTETVDVAGERLQRKESELRHADAKWSDLSAALTETQLEYNQTFSARAAVASVAHHHPVIRASITEDRCAVCGTDHVAELIQKSQSEGRCPLCDSPMGSEPTDPSSLERLKSLDQRIEELRVEITKALKTRQRVADEREAASQGFGAAQDALQAFEESNPNASMTLSAATDSSVVKREISKLESEAERFRAESRKEYKQRDAARKELLQFERTLKQQYESNAEPFIERFCSLAEDFIGLTVDIEIEHRAGKNDFGFELRLALDGQSRTQATDVSESQRFFLDIALRMALAEFMSEHGASLLIDTPEGSLDIAYEAKAGAMFSSFVEGGNSIIMTANVRSSALVLRLAEQRKKSGMQIIKMTEWADLSEVQKDEEKLFKDAFAEIEKRLS